MGDAQEPDPHHGLRPVGHPRLRHLHERLRTWGAIELGRTTTKSIVINLIVAISVDSIYGVVDSLMGWSTV
jgi:hypothetical protein